MTSARQRQANQRNALQSTGPRTADGKRRASRNATKHGLLARDLLLDDEDAAALQALTDGLRNDLHPDGELENALVDRIVSAFWRLGRCGRIEAGLLALEKYEILAARKRKEVGRHETDLLEEMARANRPVVDKEAHRTADALAEEAEAVRDSDATALAAAFSRGYASGRRDLKAVALRSRDRAGARPRAPCASSDCARGEGIPTPLQMPSSMGQ